MGKSTPRLPRLLSILLILALAVTWFGQTNKAWVNSKLGTSSTAIVNADPDQNESSYYFLSDYSSTQELVAAGDALVARVVAEGSVLLKNNNNTLPISEGSKVTLFGMGSYDPAYGGTVGSRAPTPSAAQNEVNFKTALESATYGGLEVNPVMWDFYKSLNESGEYDKLPLAPAWASRFLGGLSDGTYKVGDVDADKYTATQTASYAEYSDAAIVVITRQGTESIDFTPAVGSVIDAGNPDVLPLQLTVQEKTSIEQAKACSDKVIVILNSDNPMEIDELKKDDQVGAILWIGLPGLVGLNGVAAVITGKENPSGRLTDTYAVSSLSAPSMQNFGLNTVMDSGTDLSPYMATNGVVYQEGIYVGYRYYETRYYDSVLGQGNANSSIGTFASNGGWNYTEEVSYSFGYGLSYNTFTEKLNSVEYNAANGTVTAKVTVTNNGSTAAKHAVQLFVQLPYTDYDKANNVEKSAIQLLDFEKRIFEPGVPTEVTITADAKYLASYDYTNAKTYILEGGDYYFATGNGAHDALNHILALQGYSTANSAMDADGDTSMAVMIQIGKAGEVDSTTYSTGAKITANGVESVAITNRLGEHTDPALNGNNITYLSRNDWSGTWPTGISKLNITGTLLNDIVDVVYDYSQSQSGTSEIKWGEDTGLRAFMLRGVDYFDHLWDTLLDTVTLEEAMLMFVSGAEGLDAIQSIAMPGGTNNTDGPNGPNDIGNRTLGRNWTELEQDDPCYVSPDDFYAGYECSTMATAPVLAATFNKELISEVGKMYSNYMLWTNLVTIYSTDLNMHRTVYGGRNHEYYSEDPMLIGLIGEALVGTTYEDYGIIQASKLFALNEQENGRSGLPTYLNEQTAREIYLRAFEVVHTSDTATCMSVMSSYNRIGGQSSTYSEALNILWDEWGFTGYVLSDLASDELLYPAENSLLMGTTSMCCSSDNVVNPTSIYPTFKLSSVEKDGQLQLAVKEALHRILYAYVNSSIMNGVTDSMKVVTVITPWETAIYVVDVAVGVIWLASIAFVILKSKKNKAGEA